MVLNIVLIVSSVAVIFLAVAMMELVFQRRLIEILDRFLSRSISDYAASQSVLRKEIVEQVNDWDVDLDLEALNEAQSALHQPSVSPEE